MKSFSEMQRDRIAVHGKFLSGDSAWVIGDIAGQAVALGELLAEVRRRDSSSPIICCGDLVDRGPASPRVLEMIRETPNVIALYGNHEDLMVDQILGDFAKYDVDVWLHNGGSETIRSYRAKFGEDGFGEALRSDCRWLQTLPLFFEMKGTGGTLRVTHAPVNPLISFAEGVDGVAVGYKSADVRTLLLGDRSIIWNREAPQEEAGIFQIFGHNSHWGLKSYANQTALCIDTSKDFALTAVRWDGIRNTVTHYVQSSYDPYKLPETRVGALSLGDLNGSNTNRPEPQT